jgi:hypothetical protein
MDYKEKYKESKDREEKFYLFSAQTLILNQES